MPLVLPRDVVDMTALKCWLNSRAIVMYRVIPDKFNENSTPLRIGACYRRLINGVKR